MTQRKLWTNNRNASASLERDRSQFSKEGVVQELPFQVFKETYYKKASPDKEIQHISEQHEGSSGHRSDPKSKKYQSPAPVEKSTDNLILIQSIKVIPGRHEKASDQNSSSVSLVKYSPSGKKKNVPKDFSNHQPHMSSRRKSWGHQGQASSSKENDAEPGEPQVSKKKKPENEIERQLKHKLDSILKKFNKSELQQFQKTKQKYQNFLMPEEEELRKGNVVQQSVGEDLSDAQIECLQEETKTDVRSHLTTKRRTKMEFTKIGGVVLSNTVENLDCGSSSSSKESKKFMKPLRASRVNHSKKSSLVPDQSMDSCDHQVDEGIDYKNQFNINQSKYQGTKQSSKLKTKNMVLESEYFKGGQLRNTISDPSEVKSHIKNIQKGISTQNIKSYVKMGTIPLSQKSESESQREC